MMNDVWLKGRFLPKYLLGHMIAWQKVAWRNFLRDVHCAGRLFTRLLYHGEAVSYQLVSCQLFPTIHGAVIRRGSCRGADRRGANVLGRCLRG